MSSFPNTNGGIWGTWLLVQDEARDDLWNPRFDWNYQLRGKENAGSPSPWENGWPRPFLACGDPMFPFAVLGQDISDTGKFEYPSTISRGSTRPWFFRGVCRDVNGNVLGGAVVEAYLTAGDVAVGRAACDSNGNYECPTPFYGVNHYLVARYAGGSLAGATIDTLQPSV